jgi:hypothetical protein
MPKYVVLRDRRLKGGVPARPNLGIINTDENSSLILAFSAIKAMASDVGRIKAMFIFCHGYAGVDVRRRVCADAGGRGLALGREKVNHQNVVLWRAIVNKVENIVVYACAAADTQGRNAGTDADGRYLMGALAIHTRATVYAADRIQLYGTYRNFDNGRFEWGDWEGRVWRFYPSGAPGRPVPGPPLEFSDVMTGAVR